MGTRFEMIAYADSAEKAKEAFDEAFQTVAAIDEKLSNYRSDSELSRFCQSAPHPKPVPISEPMHAVLLAAQQISQQSNGAFDVTIGPLTKLWRRARRQKQLPSTERIEFAKSLVGFHDLIVNPDKPEAQLKRAGMQIDLGGIAKGYAIDQALQQISRHGISSALVNGGGDIALSDPPPGREHWRVQLFDGSQAKPRVLRLKNRAVATSGDLYQFVEIDGVRYSHLVDPKTGIGLTKIVSATVIAPNAMLADGWASTLALTGPAKGLELIESLPHVEACIRYRPDDRSNTIVEQCTPRFSEFVLLVDASIENNVDR